MRIREDTTVVRFADSEEAVIRETVERMSFTDDDQMRLVEDTSLIQMSSGDAFQMVEEPSLIKFNDGEAGPQGETGEGVPAGGSTGEVLKKKSNTDYDTEWGEGGGSGNVVSVFGRDGAVVAEEEDYSAFYDELGAAEDEVEAHEYEYDHDDIALNTDKRHDAATVSGDGIDISGQDISLDIGTDADEVARGNHLHTGVYDPAGSAAAVASDLADHEADEANPHSVTAAQAGADPTGTAAAEVAAHEYEYDHDAYEAHLIDETNPHSVTASQAGADPSGTASAAVASHESTYDHDDIALNTADRHKAASVSGNGISIAGQQISLDIGTGASQVAAGDHLHTGVYDPIGSADAAVDAHEYEYDHGAYDSHLEDEANPHSVTLAQVGADGISNTRFPISNGSALVESLLGMTLTGAALALAGTLTAPRSLTMPDRDVDMGSLVTGYSNLDDANRIVVSDGAGGLTESNLSISATTLSGATVIDTAAAEDLELKYNGSTQLQISSTFSYLNNTLLFPSSADYIAVRNFGDTSYIQVFDVFASNELAVGYSSAHDGLVLGISSKPIYPYNGLTFWGGYFIDSGSANDLAFKRDGSTILTLESDGFTSLADTDAIYNAGRCKFGYVGGGYTDTAGFGHLDHFGPATVALRADSTGAVRLQSDGQTLWLVAGTTMEASAGGTDVFAFSSSLCQFKVNVIHGSGLYFRPADVTGQALGTTTYKWQVYTDYLYLAGNARILNNNPLTWRNAANSAWLTGIVINGSDELSVGYCTSVDSSAAKDLALKRNGSTIASVVSAGVNLASGKVLQVNGTQVVGARVVDGDLGNTPNTGDTDTDDMIQALADLVISHGLGATS